jgi:hypothetical protein
MRLLTEQQTHGISSQPWGLLPPFGDVGVEGLLTRNARRQLPHFWNCFSIDAM